jgi:hypothetical protein
MGLSHVEGTQRFRDRREFARADQRREKEATEKDAVLDAFESSIPGGQA